MDQKKIGAFISQCRKEKGLTQAQLAEHFDISNVAVSKWETGKNLPDASIMIVLCELLGITVNELLSGERIDMEEYREKAEKQLVEINGNLDKKNKIIKIAVLVIAFAFLAFAVREIVSIPENDGVAAISGKYKKEVVYNNQGFGDGTSLTEYRYSDPKLSVNGKLKLITDVSRTELDAYLDNFENWVAVQGENAAESGYNFDRKIVTNDDYIYIDDKSPSGRHYWDYDIYIFDAQSGVLYLFRQNT